MEKKEWRERLQHDIGFLYKFDGNESWTDVHDKVLDFIEQEKLKSRIKQLEEDIEQVKVFLPYQERVEDTDRYWIPTQILLELEDNLSKLKSKE